MHTKAYYTAMKINKLLIPPTTWMRLTDKRLNEKSQTQNIVPFM